MSGSDLPDRLERLAQVLDPRDPRGVRHPLVTLLALMACAVLARARSLIAMSEWVADAVQALLERLGTAVDPLVPKRSWPAEYTIRRLLARIVADGPARAVGAWFTAGRPGDKGCAGSRSAPTRRPSPHSSSPSGTDSRYAPGSARRGKTCSRRYGSPTA
ncbi:transposase family protein [Streptomyces sp. NPDC087512]|uniref:transposase family protein n=1 Tax=Streptomyces sp. NPDC087512 TaxID=3155059 RepID=UPI00341D0976